MYDKKDKQTHTWTDTHTHAGLFIIRCHARVHAGMTPHLSFISHLCPSITICFVAGGIKMAAKKWGKAEDLKLAACSSVVFGTKECLLQISTKAICAVLEMHFPDCKYRSFAPLFHAKAWKWNIDQTLRGECCKYY